MELVLGTGGPPEKTPEWTSQRSDEKEQNGGMGLTFVDPSHAHRAEGEMGI